MKGALGEVADAFAFDGRRIESGSDKDALEPFRQAAAGQTFQKFSVELSNDGVAGYLSNDEAMRTFSIVWRRRARQGCYGSLA